MYRNNIHDGSQSHHENNRRYARYKICDHIKQRQLEGKGALKSTGKMGKGSHKVFKTVVKEISQENHLWVKLVQKFPISFQNLETLLKLPNFQDKETLARGNSEGD